MDKHRFFDITYNTSMTAYLSLTGDALLALVDLAVAAWKNGGDERDYDTMHDNKEAYYKAASLLNYNPDPVRAIDGSALNLSKYKLPGYTEEPDLKWVIDELQDHGWMDIKYLLVPKDDKCRQLLLSVYPKDEEDNVEEVDVGEEEVETIDENKEEIADDRDHELDVWNILSMIILLLYPILLQWKLGCIVVGMALVKFIQYYNSNKL